MELQANINKFKELRGINPDYYNNQSFDVYSFVRETLYEFYLSDINNNIIKLEKESVNDKIWLYKKIKYEN